MVIRVAWHWMSSLRSGVIKQHNLKLEPDLLPWHSVLFSPFLDSAMCSFRFIFTFVLQFDVKLSPERKFWWTLLHRKVCKLMLLLSRKLHVFPGENCVTSSSFSSYVIEWITACFTVLINLPISWEKVSLWFLLSVLVGSRWVVAVR